MRTIPLLAALLLVAAVVSAQPTTKPVDGNVAVDEAKASDGEPYGKVVDAKVKPVRLPIVNLSLGITATEFVGKRQVLSQKLSAAKIDDIMKPFDVPGAARSFQYFVPWSASEIVGFDVDGGRIVRLGVFFKSISDDKLKEQKSRFEKGSANSKIKVEIESAKTGASGLITSEFDGAQWYVTTREGELSPEIASAISAHKLLVGMTEEEANAAMSHCTQRDEQTSSDRRVVGYYALEAYVEEHGGRPGIPGVAVVRNREKHVATAVFELMGKQSAKWVLTEIHR